MNQILVPLCALGLGLSAVAQSGRTMRILAPAVIGQHASFAMQHPVGAAGNLYVLLWCDPPYGGAVPVTLPGFTFQGLARVDLLTSVIAMAGVLDGSGQSPVFSGMIPNVASLVGYAWDLQGVDLDLVTSTFTFADDELAMTVAAPPLPSLNMLPIAPGTFQMGSNALPVSPYFSAPFERPVHQVTISQPFWMGRNEVTQAQYQAVMGNNPSAFQGTSYPNAANRPVESVFWSEAVAYCDALTVQEAAAGRLSPGYEYRLPTEAEWEYCCRAGTTTEFHYGPTLVCGQENFSYSYHTGSYCSSPGGVQTEVVGSHAANAWGLYDMHGNVCEWCLDGWDGSANYPAGAVTDPYVLGSSSPYRVFRGGSWCIESIYCRSARRNNVTMWYANYILGFRVVCAPVLP